MILVEEVFLNRDKTMFSASPDLLQCVIVNGKLMVFPSLDNNKNESCQREAGSSEETPSMQGSLEGLPRALHCWWGIVSKVEKLDPGPAPTK